jgi:dipeptidyl aminopeptidase/acylaminoacyl peptidase
MDALRFPLRLILASILFTHIAILHAAEAPPAEAFGTLPAVDNVELSPDGKLLAWSEPTPKGQRVMVHDLETHKARRALDFEAGMKLRSLVWADNETLLSTASAFATYGGQSAADHYEVYRTYASDINTGKTTMLLMADGSRPYVTSASLLAWRTPKPKTVIMSSMDFSDAHAKQQTGTRVPVGRRGEGWLSFVFEVDTRTGKGTRLESGTAFTEDWVVNRNGEPVARSEWTPAARLFTIHAKAGMGWKEIFRSTDEGERALFGLTGDEKSIVISSVTPSGRSSVWTLPLDGSSEGTALIPDETSDVTSISFDRITRVPTSLSLGGMEQSLRWLDKDAERRFRSVAAAFKGKRVAVYGRSEDGKRVLAQVDGPSSPPVYYFIDFTKGTADIVGEAYPALAEVKLGEVRVVEYKGRDGTSIPAYLTIPPGLEGKNLPLVVLPHGGPEARDDYAFDWWAQFLAVRGYAVLQPQFRGSTGFGAAWAEAGRRQWGGLMQDDVTDGVKAMVEQGIADPARVCIVGASYGGYAALAGAAFTPDLYRCAVSVNGVSSLPAMLGYQKEHSGVESNQLAYWREHIGGSTDKNVVEKSPLNAAALIKAPVMLMHAVNDTVVPQSQSQRMLGELEKLKKPVTYVSLAGEDHWLSQTQTRVQMLKELDKFLSEHLRRH